MNEQFVLDIKFKFNLCGKKAAYYGDAAALEGMRLSLQTHTIH